MRRVLAAGAVAATAIVLSGCGELKPGGAAWAVTKTAEPSDVSPVGVATSLSNGDFGAMSQWVAEPGNFGPIGAAAPTRALVVAGYAVSRLEDGCPVAHVFASPALQARGVGFGDVSDGNLRGIFYSAKVRTAKGIHEGSSAADLATAYGTSLVDTPWRWGEGGADTRAKVLFDDDGALLFVMGPKDSVTGMMSAAGNTVDDVDLLLGGGC